MGSRSRTAANLRFAVDYFDSSIRINLVPKTLNQPFGARLNFIVRCGDVTLRRNFIGESAARIAFQGGFERRYPKLVSAQCAIKRKTSHAFDDLRPAHEQTSLWPAQQLVAAERYDIGS